MHMQPDHREVPEPRMFQRTGGQDDAAGILLVVAGIFTIGTALYAQG